MNNINIAVICHQANKALCELQGDFSQANWDDAEGWQMKSALKGVEFVKANPNAPDSATHDSWMKEKIENGWVYGEKKDPENKTHPCLVPFEKLPKHQQAKDILFKSICKGLLKC